MTRQNNNKEVITDKVRAYIAQMAHTSDTQIDGESLIFKEGYLDSMGLILMISFIEEEFQVKTSEEDLVEENFESISAISKFISRKINHSECVE